MFCWGKALTIILVSMVCVVLMSVCADESQAQKTYKYFSRFDNTYKFGSDYRASAVNNSYRSGCDSKGMGKHHKKHHKHRKNYNYKNGYYRNHHSGRNNYHTGYGYYSNVYPGGYVVNYLPYNYYYGATTYPTVTYTKKHNPNPYFNRSRQNPYFSR